MSEALDNATIDSLVAIHVMQWKEGAPGGYRPFWIRSDDDTGLYCEYWKPTEDIEQAWQVLEKFPQPHYSVRIERYPNGRWECDISLTEDHPLRKETVVSSIEVMADTAPEAICKTTLQMTKHLEHVKGRMVTNA